MNPVEKYRAATQPGKHRHDPAQEQAIESLQHIYTRLIESGKPNSTTSLIQTAIIFFRRLCGYPAPVTQGLYLWGSVGRGKTWLMHLFFDSLPFEDKLCLHFHHFMLQVHSQLSELQNQKNPLEIIAKNYAARYRVICLDEFIVTNITDAMLLYGLLDTLFKHNVTLVATSNRIPDDLYLNGLQRERFLPAIDLIKKHTQVTHLDSETDHRLALLEQSDVYYFPITDNTTQSLEQRMQALAIDEIEKGKVLSILNRNIQSIACAEEIAWFDFNQLCDAPRAAQDYIELADEFHTIILSNVPVMSEYMDDKARRFIYLIDELYHRRVKLILSAEASPDKLYTGSMLKFAFNRTTSRLIEMRSETYLKIPHKRAA